MGSGFLDFLPEWQLFTQIAGKYENRTQKMEGVFLQFHHSQLIILKYATFFNFKLVCLTCSHFDQFLFHAGITRTKKKKEKIFWRTKPITLGAILCQVLTQFSFYPEKAREK